MLTLKKITLTLALLSIGHTNTYAQSPMRETIQTEDGLTLSRYWAQESIGADLVKEEMQKLDTEGVGLETIPVAVFDMGFEANFTPGVSHLDEIPFDFNGQRSRRVIGHHGTQVAQLLLDEHGDSPHAISRFIKFSQLSRVQPSFYYSVAVNEILESENRARIISNSVGWSSEKTAELAKEIDKNEIIWVLASGNDHPKPMREHESSAPVILVGSSSPQGLTSLSSQEAREVLLLAPSDKYLASIDGHGKPSLFGGTSGATPVVAATIANLLSLAPHLKKEQILRILYKTGHTLPNSLFPSKDIESHKINAYRAFMWAKTIQEKCHMNANCWDQEVEKKDFSRLNKYAKEVDLKSASLKDLRRSYLLNPEDQETAIALIQSYQDQGLDGNARLIATLLKTLHSPAELLKDIHQYNYQAIENGHINSPYLREKSFFSSEAQELLKEIVNTDQGIGRYRAEEFLKLLTSSETYPGQVYVNTMKQSIGDNTESEQLRVTP